MKHGELIAIKDIRLDGGTQPRATIDFEAVFDYMDAMADGAKFPPVVVFYDGASYWLADGFHRVKAAEQAGVDEIACELHQGTQQDAQWYSFGANKTNGLRRTNDDKHRAVIGGAWTSQRRCLSNRQIAAMSVSITRRYATGGKNWRHCGNSPVGSAYRPRRPHYKIAGTSAHDRSQPLSRELPRHSVQPAEPTARHLRNQTRAASRNASRAPRARKRRRIGTGH